MIKEVLLVVTIMTAADKPDVRHQTTGLTLDECFEQAKDFTSHELTEDMRARGVLGYGASCMWREKPSTRQ